MGRLTSISYHMVALHIIFFTLFTINIRGINPKGSEMQDYILHLSQPPHVICLQETLLNNENEYHFHDYVLINRNRQERKGGGCAIYIYKDLSFGDVSISKKEEYIKVNVRYRDFHATIVNYYNPCIDIKNSTLLEFLQNSNKNLIIVGDFNSHNPIWGSNKLDKNGKLIEKYIQENNLCLMNDGSYTRHDIRSNGYSCIDLAIVSPSLANKTQWEVLPDNFESDHFLIKLDVVTPMSNENIDIGPNGHVPKFNFNKADWTLFNELTGRVQENNIIDKNVDNYYQNIIQFINHCAFQAIPMKNAHSKRYPNPWFNKKCQNIIKQRNKMKRKYLKTSNVNDYLEYKKYKAQAQKTIREAKSSFWRDFCTKINQFTPISKVWQKIKSMSNGKFNIEPIHPIKNNDGMSVNDPVIKGNIIADYFCKKLFVNGLSEVYPDFPKEDNLNAYLNEHITNQEVKIAIATANNSAPGPDNIKIILLQKAHKKLIEVIQNFFNYVWDTGSSPRPWHHATIIPISKPGKDKSIPSGYRPVSLTCTFCKIFERVLNNRLIWFLERNSILNPCQSGYRQDRSIADNIVKLKDDIVRAWARKHHLTAIFMDLEGAFDAVRHGILLNTLHETGIRGRMLRWICDFLRDRTFHVRMEGVTSDRKSTNRGLPQGSILSPTLFNIFIHNIDTNCQHSNVSIYADDVALWLSGANSKYMEKKLQVDINNLLDWTNKHNIQISHEKTKVVVFSQNNKTAPIYNLSLMNKHIEQVSSFKFLGIYFDRRLTWKEHLDHIISKCSTRINMLRAISGSSWGANQGTLHLFYKQYIRPVLEFGAEVYISACKTQLKRLDSIQYQSLKIATGAYKTTSLAALQVLCNEFPLEITRKLISDKYKFRLNAYYGTHPTKTCILDSWELQPKWAKSRIKKENFFHNRTKGIGNDIEINRWSPLPPWHIPEPNIDLSIHENHSKKDSTQLLKLVSVEKINTVYKNYLHIYTDGSLDPLTGHTGVSVYIPSFKKFIFKRTDTMSICRAEQTAIVIALSWLCDYRPLHSVIFTDSYSTLQLLKQSVFKAQGTIQEILLNTMSLQVIGCNVTFCWIPAHCDIQGNEIADILAKRALKRSIIDIKIKTNKSEAVCERIKFYNLQWQHEWDHSIHGRFLYDSLPFVNKKKTKCTTTRRNETIYNRLLLGKAGTKDTLFRLGLITTNMCDECNEIDDVYHYLFNCKKYNLQRNRYKGRLKVNQLTHAVIFNDSNTQSLIDYVKETNMFNKI